MSFVVIVLILSLASGESDFMPQTVNLTFTADDPQQSQTVVIDIMDDSYLETNEQFNCTLALAGTYDSSVQIDPALATVTIIDDDSECATLPILYCMH